MSYSEQTWADDVGGDTPITAARLNHMEAGIAAAESADDDLTQIAGLSPADNDLLQRKSGVWTNRTPAQVRSDMALATVATSGLYTDLTGHPTGLTGLDTTVTGAQLNAMYLLAPLTPEEYGAVGDGSTDDAAHLNACFAAAAGRMVWLNPAKTYAHGAALTIGQNGTIVLGGGTLKATNAAAGQSGVAVTGNDVTVMGITLTCPSASTRQSGLNDQKLSVQGARVQVLHVDITSSAAAGIFCYGASRFLIQGCKVSGTLADGVHMTNGCTDGTVIGCTSTSTGDDGFAVVSYLDDTAICSKIRIEGCSVYSGAARGFAIVGGTDIVVTSPYVHTTVCGGIYISCETNIHDITHVSVKDPTIINANTGYATIEHGALLIANGDTYNIQYVDISNVTIRDTPSGAPWDYGILQYDTSTISDIWIDGVRITNGPSTVFGTTGTLTRVYRTNIQKDGAAV